MPRFIPYSLGAPLLAIVYYFLDLCMLRRTPQQLPASTALLGLLLAAGLFGSVLLSVTAGANVAVSLGQGLLDLLLLLGVLRVALRLVGKPQRFVQTASALVGADTLIGLVALLPLSLATAGGDSTGQLLIPGLMFLLLVVWSVTVAAHILRHAFEITLAQGAFIAVTYDFVSFVVVGGAIPSQV